MMADFGIELASAGSSSKALHAVADQVDHASKAGQSAQLASGAYGVLCQFIPALLKPVQQAACSALHEEAAALRDSGMGLASAQAKYIAADELVASTLPHALG